MKKITFTAVVFLLLAMANYAPTSSSPINPIDGTPVLLPSTYPLIFNNTLNRAVSDESIKKITLRDHSSNSNTILKQQ